MLSSSKQSPPYFNSRSIIIKKLMKIQYFMINKGYQSFNIPLVTLFILIRCIQMISFNLNSKIWNTTEAFIPFLRNIIPLIRLSSSINYISNNSYIIMNYVVIVYVALLILLTVIVIYLTSIEEIENMKKKYVYKTLLKIWTCLCYITSTILLIPINDVLLSLLECFDTICLIYSNSYLNIIELIMINFIVLIFTFLYNTQESSLLKVKELSKKSTLPMISFTSILFILIQFIIQITFWFNSNSEYNYILWFISLTILYFSYLNSNQTLYSIRFLEYFFILTLCLIIWDYLASIIVLLLRLEYNNSMTSGLISYLFGLIPVSIFSIVMTSRKYKIISIFKYNIFDTSNIKQEISYLTYILSEKENQYKFTILLDSYIHCHMVRCNAIDCILHTNLLTKEQKVDALISHIQELYFHIFNIFSDDLSIQLDFISFSLENKMNVNLAYTYLERLQLQNNLSYCHMIRVFSARNKILHLNKSISLLKGVTSSSLNDSQLRDNNSVSFLSDRILLLQDLIIFSTRRYIDLWSSLSFSMIEQANVTKLFSLSLEIRNSVKEIKNIWDKEHKNMNKLTDQEKSILELLHLFTKNVIFDKELEIKVEQLLNGEIMREHDDSGEYFNLDGIDLILENNDMIVFSRANINGECKILKASNSFCQALSYKHSNLANKPIETIIPPLFRLHHSNMLSRQLGLLAQKYKKAKGRNEIKYSFNKTIYSFPIAKNGYMVPLKQTLAVKKDIEIANNYIIKTKFEKIDPKNEFYYHMLVTDELQVTSISSSCIELGLTIDIVNLGLVNVDNIIKFKNNQKFSLNNLKINTDEFASITYTFDQSLLSKDNKNQQSKLFGISNKKINKKETRQLILQVKTYLYSTFNNTRVYHFILKEHPIYMNEPRPSLSFIPLQKRVFIYDIHSQMYKITEITNDKALLKGNGPLSSPKKLFLMEKILARKRRESLNNNKESNISNKDSPLKLLPNSRKVSIEEEVLPTQSSNLDFKLLAAINQTTNNDESIADSDNVDILNTYEKIDLSNEIFLKLRDENASIIETYIKRKITNYTSKLGVIQFNRNQKLELEESFRSKVPVIEDNIYNYIANYKQSTNELEDENNNDNSANILNHKFKLSFNSLLNYLFPFKIKYLFKVYNFVFVLLIMTFGTVQFTTNLTTLNERMKNFDLMFVYNKILQNSMYTEYLVSRINKFQSFLNIVDNYNYSTENNDDFTSTLLEPNFNYYFNNPQKLNLSNSNSIKNLLNSLIDNKISMLKDLNNEYSVNFNKLLGYLSTFDLSINNKVISYYDMKSADKSTKTSLKLIDYYQLEIINSFKLIQNLTLIENSTTYDFFVYNTQNSPFQEMFSSINQEELNLINTFSNINETYFYINIAIIIVSILAGTFIVSAISFSRERVLDLVFIINKKIFKKFKNCADSFINLLLTRSLEKEDFNEEKQIKSVVVKEQDIKTSKFNNKNNYNLTQSWSKD